MSIHSMAFAYALVLGFGLATRFPAAGLIVSMWALINGKVLVGTGVLCGFGIGRAIPLVVAWRVRKVLSVYALVNTVSRSTLAMEMASGLLLSIVGGMLLGGGWVFAK